MYKYVSLYTNTHKTSKGYAQYIEEMQMPYKILNYVQVQRRIKGMPVSITKAFHFYSVVVAKIKCLFNRYTLTANGM